MGKCYIDACRVQPPGCTGGRVWRCPAFFGEYEPNPASVRWRAGQCPAPTRKSNNFIAGAIMDPPAVRCGDFRHFPANTIQIRHPYIDGASGRLRPTMGKCYIDACRVRPPGRTGGKVCRCRTSPANTIQTQYRYVKGGSRPSPTRISKNPIVGNGLCAVLSYINPRIP